MAAILIASVCAFGSTDGVGAAASDLDVSFSGDGIVELADAGSAGELTVSPLGRVTVIRTLNASATAIAVNRILPSGAADTSFSNDGYATFDVGGVHTLYDAVEQSDGKVVVLLAVGATAATEPYVLVRINSNGTLDSTFDGDGVATVPWPHLTSSSYQFTMMPYEGLGLKIDTDGAFEFGGLCNCPSGTTHTAVVRMLSNGAADPDFLSPNADLSDVVIGSKRLNNWLTTDLVPAGPGKILMRQKCLSGCVANTWKVSAWAWTPTSLGFNPTTGGGSGPAVTPNGGQGLLQLADGTLALPVDGSMKYIAATGGPGPDVPVAMTGTLAAAAPDGGFYARVANSKGLARFGPGFAWDKLYGGNDGANVTVGGTDQTIEDVVVDASTGKPLVLWKTGSVSYRVSRLTTRTSTPFTRPVEELLGTSQPGTETVADPVNTATGNLTHSEADLSADAFGLAVQRSYNGLSTAVSTSGARWKVSVGPAVAADGASMMVELPDGSRFRFDSNGSGGWNAPDGIHATLTTDTAPPIGGGPLPMLRLEYLDGHIDRFDTTGRLIEQLDWDGVSAASTYDAQGRLDVVTSSTGITVTFAYDVGGKLSTVTSSLGRSISYTYDAAGLLASATDEFGATSTMTYTAEGWLATLIDPSGVLLMENTYDAAGRVRTQTSGTGGVTSFLYVPGDGVTEVTDSLTGTSVQYHHDADGKVIGISDPFGNIVQRIYDEQSNLVSGVDRLGNTATATYDTQSRLTSTSEPGVGTTTYTFDALDRVETVTDPWNSVTTYGYEGAERLPSTVTDPLNHITTYDIVDGLVMSVTDADGVSVSHTYDPHRNRTGSTNAYNKTTVFGYDIQDRPTTVTTPSGKVTTTAYDPITGRVSAVTGPDNGVTSYTYDDAGRVLTVSDPTNAITTNTYNTAGLLETTTRPGGAVTSFTYDANGQLTKTTEPGGGERLVAHGPLGRVNSTTDPIGRATTYEYDADGHTTKVTDPAMAATQTIYDASGRPFKKIDPAGRETVTAFDAHGRPQSVTAPGNRVTAYTYDVLGRLTVVTNPRGGQTITDYTDGGRTDTMTEPTGLITDYDYDLAGRLLTVTAPGNRVTGYTYTNDDQTATVTRPGGLVNAYTYDPAGRIATITDPASVVTTRTWSLRGELLTEQIGQQGTATFTYNPNGTMATATDPLGALTSFGYDARGNQTSRTNAQSGIDTWVYNSANELTSTKDPLNRETVYTYTPAGLLATATDPTGRKVTLTYNPDGQPATRAELNGPTAAYTYDQAGRLATTIDPTGTYLNSYDPGDQLAATTTPSGRTTNWTYDSAGRRSTLTYPDGSRYGYTYDTAGRLWKLTPLDVMADTFTRANGTVDTARWATTVAGGGTATIQSNQLALTLPSTSGATASITSQAPAALDHDTVLRYQFAATTSTTAAVLSSFVRFSSSGNVRAEITSNSSSGKIYKQIGSTTTQLGTFTVPVSTNRQRIRLQLTGTTVRVRVWADGTTEPTTWTTTLTTATGVTTAGQAKMTATRSKGSNTITVDNWAQTEPTNPPAPIATYTYNNDDQITGEALTGGSRTRTYTTGQLTTFNETLPGLTRNTTLTYDTTGRVATETTAGATTTYGYDNASQLTSSTPTTGTASAWTYDNLGRRTTETIGATTTKYEYDQASQLCWTTTGALPPTPTCAAPPAGATTYTYDNAGRRVTETKTATDKITYTHDTAGRLASGVRNNGASTTTQTRTYTPTGDLATANSTVGSTTTTNQFDWDSALGIPQLLTSSTGTNAINTVNGPGGWVSERRAYSSAPIGTDAYGSALPTTGSTLARANTYSAYGTPNGPDTFAPRLGYRGELTLDNLIYLRARNYAPTTGQFTTTDPLTGRVGATTLMNPYHYADNSPLQRMDPTGLFSMGDGDFPAIEFLVPEGCDACNLRSEVLIGGADENSELYNLEGGDRWQFAKYQFQICQNGGFFGNLTGASLTADVIRTCQYWQGQYFDLGGDKCSFSINDHVCFSASLGWSAVQDAKWDIILNAVTLGGYGCASDTYGYISDSNAPSSQAGSAILQCAAFAFQLGALKTGFSGLLRQPGSSTATNTAKGLGDDFTRALDDIDNGLPRPNVRNPKPFANDGRGGTTRLPVADGAGNPVSYVEHTVSPRPPGGSLDGSRIVVGSDGTVWATTDHFGTWTQVR